MSALTLESVKKAFPEFQSWSEAGDHGGHKNVYFVRGAGQESALKILKVPVPQSDEDEPEIRSHLPERLRREASALKEISSPYLPTILDGPDERDIGNARYLWYREPRYGQSLHRRVTEEGPLSIPELKLLVGALLEAERTLNENKLVHRDIKPLNVLEHPEDGRPVLIDLGVALHLELPRITEVTATRTNLYAAPEQFDHNKSVDHRTDLFQIGITAYFAAAGIHPFIAENEELAPVEYFRRMADGPDLQPLLERGVSERFANLIERCMAGRQNRRFRTVELAIEEYRAACE